MATKTLLTGEEFFWARDPKLRDAGKRHELVRGEVVEFPLYGARHARIRTRLGCWLHRFVEDHDLGHCGFSSGFYLERDPDTVRAPDIWFLTNRRYVHTDGYFYGAPDLAVEIVSFSNSAEHVARKVAEYLRAGARLVWVIDSDCKYVTTYPCVQVLSRDEMLTGGDVLPGFSVSVSRIFRSKTTEK